MKEKFGIGEVLAYENYGLCRINDIKKMAFSPKESAKEYYVLSPLSATNSTYYVPVSSEKAVSKLRRPLTKKEIDGMLTCAKENECRWSENRQLRYDKFQATLKKGISAELIAMVGCIISRQKEISREGKKLSVTDENILMNAKKLVEEEFSFSLGKDPSQTEDYICRFIPG